MRGTGAVSQMSRLIPLREGHSLLPRFGQDTSHLVSGGLESAPTFRRPDGRHHGIALSTSALHEFSAEQRTDIAHRRRPTMMPTTVR
jgi:hypothetical protein